MAIKIVKYLDFTVRIINSFDDINDIQSEWIDLLKKEKFPNIYSDPSFFISQFNVRSPGATPYITTFYIKDKLVGIVLAKNIKRKLNLKLGYLKLKTPKLNILEVEIDGILCLGNSEYAQKISSYLDSLLEGKEFQIIEFQHLSEKNLFWNILNKKDNNKLRSIERGIEYLIKIRDDLGKTNVYHKAKTLRNFRRADRIIREYFNNLELKIYTDEDQIKEFLVNSEEICKKSYHCELGVGVINNKEWYDKIITLIKNEYFIGFILYGDAIPLAYNFGLKYSNYFYGFNMSFDLEFRKYQPGTYLLRRMIEILVENEFDYFHLGYGEAEYKKLYSNQNFKEGTIKLFGKSFSARLAFVMLRTTQSINSIISNILEKMGIINKIKKLWREKLSNKK